MAIAKLKKVNIFFLKDQTDAILSFLQEIKKIELFDIKNKKGIIAERTGLKLGKNFLFSEKNESNENDRIGLENQVDFEMSKQNQNISNSLNEKIQLMTELEKANNILEHYEVKKNLLEKLNPKLIISKNDFNNFYNSADKVQNLVNIAQKINTYLRQLDVYRSKRVELLENMESIKPWLNIKLRLDEIFGTYYTRTIAGIIPIEQYQVFLSTKIEGIEDDAFEIFEINKDKNHVYFLILSYFEITSKIKEHISKFGKILHWEGMEKTPTQIYEQSQRYYDALKRKENLIIKFIQKRSDYLKDIKIFYDKIYNEWLKLQKNNETYTLNNVSILAGWIREKDLYEFQLNFESRFPEIFLLIEEPDFAKDDIPIAFENYPTIKPFEIITDLYGRPDYSGIDPTIFLSPFFMFFFGICLGDAGYGLIMTALAILGKKLLPKKNSMRNIFKLLLYTGFSTFLIGILTGTFFGNMVNFLPKNLYFIKEFLAKIQIIDTMSPKGSLIFLGFCLVFGYIHLCFGLFLKVYLCIRDKQYKDLFLYGLPAMFIQLSLLPVTLYYVLDFNFIPAMIIKIFLFLLLFSIILIAVKQWISNDELMEKIFWCIYANYSAITGTFLSDTLSYARLFALGLSGGLLGLAINEIAAVFKSIPFIGIIFMILIMIGGHIFSLAVSGLGSFVHSCRLQYLEFFTKFFEASGREMKPFCNENKYIEIDTE
ncbi:MAG: hypothetical protein LBF97_02605 [Elusimicrobiota bacterium]|jgi:V/A-type H+-transporting ATPase subunit I|nr:hypothetical protein [Elusimicrobiota bacterium]